MTAAGFDSFDTSGFDAFSHTGFDARGPASLPRASVWAIDANGGLRWVFDTQSNCNGISVGGDGMVWVAGALGGGSTVWRINRNSGTLAGQFLVPYGGGQANAPIKAVQSGSYFYVASNGNLYKYTTSGFVLQFAEPTSYIADMKLIGGELYCAEWTTGPTKRSTQFGIVLQRASLDGNPAFNWYRSLSIDYSGGTCAWAGLGLDLDNTLVSLANPQWPRFGSQAGSWFGPPVFSRSQIQTGVKLLSSTEAVWSYEEPLEPGLCKSTNTNTAVWKSPEIAGRLDANGSRIYGTNHPTYSGSHLVVCLDSSSGSKLWEYDYPKGGFGTDVVADPDGNGCYVCGYRSNP